MYVERYFQVKHENYFRYLTIDTNTNLADELIVSPESTSQIYQAFFLCQQLIPYRVLVLHINLITIFCFFHDGRTNLCVFMLDILFYRSFVDEALINNEIMNKQIVDIFKKDLVTMLPNFEEHLRKKYPAYVERFFIESIRILVTFVIVD
jgi:hypothetical protein